MTVSRPNFSPFPFERLSRVSRDQAAIESALARWVATLRARPTDHLSRLLGSPLRVRSSQLADRAFDPYATFAEVRLGGLAIVVAGSGAGARALAQRLLGGMAELPAPRSPTVAEQAVWSLVVAAALADLGIAADVWPLAESAKQTLSREASAPSVPRTPASEWMGRGGLIAEPAASQPAAASAPMAADRAAIGRAQTVAGKRSIERTPGPSPSIAHAATNPATPAAQPESAASPSDAYAAGQVSWRTTGQPASDAHAAGQVSPRTTGQPASDAHPAGQMSPRTTGQPASDASARVSAPPPASGPIPIELAVELAGIPITAVAWCPAELLQRAPPERLLPEWPLELPIVVARCALEKTALRALAVRDVIVVDAGIELRIGDGALGLSAPPNALEARVAIAYRPRDMALPDDAHLELTVRLGTVRMSLRRVGELAVGEVIGLGKPLAGPYEICADGRAIGSGELVDLDGEVGVRIVSLIQES